MEITNATSDSLSTASPSSSSSSIDNRDETLALFEIIIQILILILALIGNSFVLYVLLKQRQLRPWSRIYLFMAHLSLADLLVAIFNILPQLIWDITFRFKAGDFMCRSVKYFQVFVLYLSTYIIVAMSIDRYLTIQSIKAGHWRASKTFKIMIIMAWILSTLFSIPQAIIFSVKEIKLNSGVFDCWATFTYWNLKFYVSWFVTSVFIIPLIIIVFCYGTICFKLWKYNPSRTALSLHVRYAANDEDDTDREMMNHDKSDARISAKRKVQFIDSEKDLGIEERNRYNLISRAKVKTIKLTITVVICFFCCWAPFCITQLCLAFNPPNSDIDVGPIQTILLLLASLNSCTNPWIYLAFSDSLLNQLRVCFGLGLKRADDNDSVGDEEPDSKPTQRKTIDTTLKSCLGYVGSQTTSTSTRYN